MPVENQVVTLYAGTKGFLDEIPVEDVQKCEAAMQEFMNTQKADVLKEIKDTQTLGKETEEKLIAAIEEFKKTFKA